MTDPYHALGLNRNPFRVEPEPGVTESLFLSRHFPPRPEAGRRRFVQVIGPKGAGKTTLLLHWRRTTDGPYRHVPPGPARFLPPPLGSLVYWDEADRIPLPILYPALSASRYLDATIVVGTHDDLSGVASTFGFSVETFELPIIHPMEVMKWARARIKEDSTDSGTPGIELEYSEACRVARDADRSWRRVGGLLHRWVAEKAQ